ncbi:ferritin-like domain-containing protein [Clostridium sp.]|uniref:ferritin-like domain-containing protein n=1 Tax=Clostridium sp. TaxID=1506 RepID=UPI002910D0E9|nr:ferritin-like domain-containing protein [Clostridium sp.]MDU3354998.1 ferritin-like domain-containing protein [Clostridium sp.]
MLNNETNISYHVDLPYPDIKVEKENSRYANILLHNYSGIVSEFTAIDQYVYHKFKLFKDCPAVSQAIGEIAMVEMHHLEMLGELILLLGEDPRYWIKKKDKRYYWNGLDYDIQAEVVAIRDYNKALNEISDPNIVKIIERIILDEELHLKIFKELYAKYVKTPE